MKPARSPVWRYRLQRAGWPAWLGGAMVLAALAIGPWVSDPLHTEAASLAAQAERLRRAQAQRPADVLQRASDQGAAFVAELPASDAALAAVQDLHQLAQQHGVRLASGEYRLVAEPGQRWQRYEISLPAQANDLALRRWMADALNRWPSLALDDWSVSREQATQDALQARVRWSFYLRSPS
ncbi:MAG: hypothetical protein IBJ04_04560 [Hydrogenophaga sp.]|uniref:GspMb/PilO family protein n=1 Tax=Hydrogenophaga sp. TaxID=1904254 RepID=UPI00257F870B|nr:GspMb/PilO family protein [Hydrogenophaga sp.]MBL0943577.1 hypothetical protein [Hydrogenophaga sp.]